MTTGEAIIRALFAVVVLLIIASTCFRGTIDAHGHSSGPVIVNARSYSMQPGETLTQDMRVCLLTGGNFTVSNVIFDGNYSNWAKVDVDLPVRAVGADNGASSSIDIPVSVTVPTNFTKNHALIQAVVEIQTTDGAFPELAAIPIFIRESNSTAQNPADCNFFRDVQTGITYGIIILIASGGALMGLAYLVYRRSKKHSKENKASSFAKLFSVLFIVIGSLLLIAGLFLLVVQRIL